MLYYNTHRCNCYSMRSTIRNQCCIKLKDWSSLTPHVHNHTFTCNLCPIHTFKVREMQMYSYNICNSKIQKLHWKVPTESSPLKKQKFKPQDLPDTAAPCSKFVLLASNLCCLWITELHIRQIVIMKLRKRKKLRKNTRVC